MTEVGRCRAARGDASRRQVCLDMAGQPVRLVILAERVLAVFGLEGVDVNGSIGGLRGNVLV